METEREKQDRERWIDWMIEQIAMFSEEDMRDELSDYYNLIKVNQRLIYLLSNGSLSKPNYKFEVFKEFLEKNFTPKSRNTEKEK